MAGQIADLQLCEHTMPSQGTKRLAGGPADSLFAPAQAAHAYASALEEGFHADGKAHLVANWVDHGLREPGRTVHDERPL